MPVSSLMRLGGLDHADDARQHAQHAAFGAARHEPRRRRLGIEAAVARAVLGGEHRRLAFEAEDAAVGVRHPHQHAGVVHQVARREVVGAVEDDVVALEQAHRVVGRQRLFVGLDLHVRVQRVDLVLRRRQLGAADVVGRVQQLPLQVAVVDDVEVDDADAAHARRRQIHRGRRPQSARADAQHAARLDPALPVHADLRHDQVAAVALDLLGVERRQLGLGGGAHDRSPRRAASWSPAPPATDGTMLSESPGFTGVCSFCR